MAIIGAYLVPHPPLIFPEIGRGEEKTIQRTIDAYMRAGSEIASAAPDTVVILTPHSVMYRDYFHISPGAGARGDMSAFRAGRVALTVDYDEEFVACLCARAKKNQFPAGTEGERDASLDHAAMIPLRFILESDAAQNRDAFRFKVVRIGMAGLPLARHAALGEMIARTSESLGKKTIVIASGDLSHRLKDDGPYGFAKEGPVFDAKITDIVKRGALNEILSLGETLCENAGECGLRPLAVLAGSLADRKIAGELYSYEGPFGVGYAVGRFAIVRD